MSSSSGKTAIAWSVGDKLVKRLVQFVLSIFLARLLSPDDFGVVAMASIFINWAEVFRDFGLGQSIVQKKDVSETQVSTIFYINVVMGCIIAVVFFIIAPLAAKFYDEDMIAWVIRIAGVTFIINSLNIVQNSLLIKKLNYKVGTVASFLASTISGAIGVLFAFLGFGIWSLLIQSVASSIITTLYIWSKSKWHPQRKFNFSETKSMFNMGIGFMAQGFIDNVFTSLGSMFIGKIHNPAAVGLYSRGHDLAVMPETTILLPVSRPFFPIFAKQQDRVDELKITFFKSLHLLTYGMSYCCGILTIASVEIITILYGAKWSDSIPILTIVSVMLPFCPIWTITTSLWKGLGKIALVAKFTLLLQTLSLISIAFMYLDIRYYAAAMVASYIVAAIIKSLVNRHILQVSLFKQYKELVIQLIIIAVAYILFNRINIQSYLWSFVIKFTGFTAVYFMCGHLFKMQGHTLAIGEIRSLYNTLRGRITK